MVKNDVIQILDSERTTSSHDHPQKKLANISVPFTLNTHNFQGQQNNIFIAFL